MHPKIIIATGITENYIPRAAAYFSSLVRFERDRTAIFTVNFTPEMPEPGEPTHIVPVDYSKCLQQPKWMLQSGGFTVFAPPDWDDNTIIIFTDADAVLQRPLDDEEIESIVFGCLDGGVMIGRNKPDPTQTLANESLDLFPKFSDPHEIERRFPNQAHFLCKNTGMVIATLGTWRKLYAHYCVLWPRIDETWGHYACVQWGICYVVQKFAGLHLVDIPLSLHAHGHLGPQIGVTIDADGIARADGKVIFFRHAL